jgi:hypothetical protein
MSAQSASAGMEPYEVGRRVLDAIVNDELYVLTHPETRVVVAERHDRLMHGFDRAEAFRM